MCVCDTLFRPLTAIEQQNTANCLTPCHPVGTETLHPPAVQTPLNSGAFHPAITGARWEYGFRARRGKDAEAGCDHVRGYPKRLLNQYGDAASLAPSSVSLLMASAETRSGLPAASAADGDSEANGL